VVARPLLDEQPEALEHAREPVDVAEPEPAHARRALVQDIARRQIAGQVADLLDELGSELVIAAVDDSDVREQLEARPRLAVEERVERLEVAARPDVQVVRRDVVVRVVLQEGLVDRLEAPPLALVEQAVRGRE
jgi:hypothetical protein